MPTLAVHERPGFSATLTGFGVRSVMRPLSVAIPASPPGLVLLDGALTGMLRLVSRPRDGVECAPVRVDFEDGTVVGEWVRAPGVTARGAALLYIHGGAFVACSPRTPVTRPLRTARPSHLDVFAVSYRKAPRFRFPTANNDVWRAYRWLTSEAGGAPVAVAGDSAGGYLAVVTALTAIAASRRGDGYPPAALLVLSPVTDATLNLARTRERNRRQKDPFAAAAAVSRVVGLYTAGASAREISVLDADFRGICPTMIHVGGTEMLLGDARALHARVKAAGGVSCLHIWPGQVHVFPALFRYLPQARMALSLSGAFLRNALAVGEAHAATQ